MDTLDNKIIQRQIFVSGQVQGVFFRESCRQQATQLKLRGGVRNLRDGRVEVKVSGEKEAVEALIKWLKIGPKYAKVSIIEVIDIAAISINTDALISDDSALCLNEVETRQFVVWPTK